jgi:hypothetical protein
MRTAGTAIAGAALMAATLAASPMLAAPAGAATAATATSARHGHEHFYVSSRVAGAKRDFARASGVLDARGYAKPGALHHGHGTIWLVLRHGSIRLTLAVTSSSATVPSQRTCAFAEVYRGTYAVRGGARGYARASGAGTFYTRISGRLARSRGRCTTRFRSYWRYTSTSGSLRW